MLAGTGAAVLVAPPGAGKTTVVPLALRDEEWIGGGKVVVLEPRRLATRAAARRMATLLGEADAGGTVGYRVRRDTRVGPGTRIEVVTEGILTRMLQSDPGLEGIGLVVFDEFHERSIHADLGLALSLQSRALFRDDLRILVMSATLDAAPVAALLNDAGVVEASGRQYPVETRFRERPVDGWIEPAVAAAVGRALGEEEGSLLVFLPGVGEIRRTAARLRDASLPGDVDLVPLYGNLPRDEQDRAITPAPPGRRKVVLATAIAETSLTIEGVRVVVDAGLMRVPRFDPGTGMTRLETRRVTRDAADQRRGRAGRTAPGVCYRLWTEAEDRGLVPRRRAEILDADLAALALELAVWGATPDELRWLDPPPPPAHEQALELLRELDALDDAGEVTGHGRRLAGLGLHPRLANMLVRSRELGLAGVACDVAALLGQRDILEGESGPPEADLRLRLEAMERGRRGGGLPGAVGRHRVARGRLRRALDEAGHWRRSVAAGGAQPSAASTPRSRDSPRAGEDGHGAIEGAGRVAALAYPDRIGQRRPGERGRFLLRNGRGARLVDDQLLARADWIVALEVEGSGADARIFLAAPLAEEDVEETFAGQIEEVEEVVWDAGGGRVRARRLRTLGALVLSEAPLADAEPAAVAAALMEGIRQAGLERLPWTRKSRQLLERLRFLHHVDPDTWPDLSDEALAGSLESWLGPFLAGCAGLDDLARVDLVEALMSRVGWRRRAALDRLAPTHLEVPSGSRIPVDYSDPEAPTLAVRVQEVFGWRQTPRLAGGRVPVTMALLSPAQRPVQVTTDLASFWRDAYFDVKKDLLGRYPKHHWPDDPLSARATRGARPRD